ncbi:MAG: hypothetical protein ACLSFZ_03810 [Frisingicoccus sp.]
MKYAHQIHKLTQELETNMRDVKNVKGMYVWPWPILFVIRFCEDFQISGCGIRGLH